MKYYPLIKSSENVNAVILANGEFPSHPLPLKILNTAPFAVCCDGAANEYISRGYKPDAIVGDGDSLSDENQKLFNDILYLDHDQETNDQTKAVLFCLSKSLRNIIILGATGKREDHTIGNISLLMDYLDKDVTVEMITDYGIFTPACNDGKFECVTGEQISIINFGATGVKGENLYFPLRNFNNWWQGTLNETLDDHFIIHARGKYLVFRSFGDS